MSFLVVLMLFNLLATASAIVCATRSYRRYGSAGRAVLAGFGGLMILPLLFALTTAAATSRATWLP
ncbi:hypothetical protein [Rhodococcus pyridinivorans]|uniref:hypothetical protein n=1 Tax=Rhodococcus pyridinivorans TaxID=103816 RepID=UPI001110206E|nr:hypothetical protein [Rhodococcus pyridinivorans]QQM55738.1 hypothetical protein JGU70_23150 [Rhodococcus pyridinivorans]